MKETLNLRVDEEYAPLLFKPNEGKRLGDSIRKIAISSTDPRYAEIGKLQKMILEKSDRAFFYGWSFQRRYDKHEVAKAALFHLKHFHTFEPAGEECGTQYDERTACPKCKAGAQQLTKLVLDSRKIPKNVDIARTIAGEIIVSERFVKVYRRSGMTGASFPAIEDSSKGQRKLKDWHQLMVTSRPVEITAPTKVGIAPFDEDEQGECRCSEGDLIGLGLLSEVSVERSSYDGSDIVESKQYIGVRRGLLRPERVLLISPRFRNALVQAQLKRFDVEVAYLSKRKGGREVF